MEPTDDGGRHLVSLNDGWSFRPAWSAEARDVELPHCWNDRDTFQVGVAYRQGTATYARSFELPAAVQTDREDRWELRSEGFYGVGRLWVDDRRVCRVDGNYLGLREDVTRHIRPGRLQTIALRLSNAYRRYVLPGKADPDFLLHGGLAGGLWLVRLPGLHLDDRSPQVTCSGTSTAQARVSVAVTVRNTRDTAGTVRLAVSIVSPRRGVVAARESEAIVVPSGQAPRIALELPLEHPEVWDLDRPNLYEARCELRVDGRTVDATAVRFGAREAVFDGDRGFFLNGNRVFLQGVNRHASMPGFGNAMPPELHRADARQIRAIGLNFVRLSHYPQHPSFLDACDEEGLLVYAEIASWKSVRPGPWARAACRQLRAMILRDRNHPSIVLWGFGNESRSRLAFRTMGSIVAALDPARATVYAENHLHRGVRWRTLQSTDVLGINYELDRLDDAHAWSRDGRIVISEIGNCAYTRRGDVPAELKQIARWEHDLALIEARPFVAGYALWCHADYASQRKGRRRRQSGLVDAWRLPKLSASYMQARTARALFVAVHGDWSERAADGPRQVHVFSNAARLTAVLNGKALAEVPASLYTMLTVPFASGVLEIVAARGDERQTARLVPHGCGTRIVVEPERCACPAAARETVGVLIRVTDDEGRTASDHDGLVAVMAEGPVRVRFPAREDAVEIHAGLGRCFVTGTGQAGYAALRGRADGLREGAGGIAFDE